MDKNSIAIYPTHGKIYFLYVDNATPNSGMAWFNKQGGAYRLVMDQGVFKLIKGNFKEQFPLGRKIEDLVFYENSRKYTNPWDALNDKLINHFFKMTGHRFDLEPETSKEWVKSIVREALKSIG